MGKSSQIDNGPNQMGRPEQVPKNSGAHSRVRPGALRLNCRFLVDAALVALLLTVAVYILRGGVTGHVSTAQEGLGEWKSLWQFIIRRNAEGSLEPGFLLIGLGNTLRISFWALLLAGAIGLFTGFCRAAPVLFLRIMAASYVGLARNVPPLVLIFVIYFFIGLILERIIPWDALARVLGAVPGLWLLVPQGQLSSFFAAVLALGLYEGAYFSEVVRAGLLSVPKGQWEAAASLGLPRRTVVFRVAMPQAFRLMLPPLVSQTVSLLKESSIVSVISVRELTFQGRELINSTYMVLEIWLTVTLCYLAVCLLVSGLGALLERRVKWQML